MDIIETLLPGVGRTLFPLDEEEAVTMPEMLGALRIAVKLADPSREIPSQGLEAGDGLVVIGTSGGVAKIRTLLGAP
jgi:K+/H+ antiporter YhaU regulatory subunit KhtT